MHKKTIPLLITIFQIVGILHLWYANVKLDGHIPISFIELHFLAVANIIILGFSCFSYFKGVKKTNLWLLPIGLAILIILLLVTTYLVMGINKYQ